jgi:hypothetical protein
MLEIESNAEEVPTEESILEAAKAMTASYGSVVYLVDYEGVLLPKAFSAIQKKRLITGFDEPDSEIEDEVYKLPTNSVFINILRKLLEAEKSKTSVMKGYVKS